MINCEETIDKTKKNLHNKDNKNQGLITVVIYNITDPIKFN